MAIWSQKLTWKMYVEGHQVGEMRRGGAIVGCSSFELFFKIAAEAPCPYRSWTLFALTGSFIIL